MSDTEDSEFSAAEEEDIEEDLEAEERLEAKTSADAKAEEAELAAAADE